MRQKAVVLETGHQIAKIQVMRSTMCEGCEKRGKGGTCACGELMFSKREMIAEASNEIGAEPGELVEIETDSAVVLRYAALVFLLPVAAFIVLYGIADALTAHPYIPWIAAGAGFLFSFLPALIAERRRRGKAPEIRIVSRNAKNPNRSEETE